MEQDVLRQRMAELVADIEEVVSASRRYNGAVQVKETTDFVSGAPQSEFYTRYPVTFLIDEDGEVTRHIVHGEYRHTYKHYGLAMSPQALRSIVKWAVKLLEEERQKLRLTVEHRHASNVVAGIFRERLKQKGVLAD